MRPPHLLHFFFLKASLRAQQIRDPRLPLPYLLTSIYINLNIKQKSRQHKIKIEKILNPYTQCQPTDLSLSKRDIPSVWGWKFIEVRQKVGTGMAKMLNLETSILARCSLGQHCCQHCCQLCQNGTKYKQDTTNNIGFSFWLLLGAQGVTLSVCLSVRSAQSAHSSYFWLKSSSRLQDNFRMTLGWLQDDSESIIQAFREDSEITQKALRESLCPCVCLSVWHKVL